MKKKVSLLLLLSAGYMFSQVGINTSTPTRMLHVNGDFKISNSFNASENALYDKILIADKNGNIDYINKSDFLPIPGEGHSNKETYSSIYNRTTGTGNELKALKCGKFAFVFDDSSASNIKFYLLEKPSSNVSIYMNMEQNWDDGGFQFYQGTGSGNTSPFIFTPTNYNKAQLFASANVADYEQNVMHFQYPGDEFFYRLTIYRVKHSDTSFDFVSACEKF